MQCPNCAHQWEPATRVPLSKRQAEVRDFLLWHMAAKGYTPSYQEVADHFGFKSLATVSEHMSNLERKGILTKEYNKARTAQVLT